MQLQYYNHVFALLISKPRFDSNNLYQNRPEIELFLPTNTKFWNPEIRPQLPVPPAAGSFPPHPKTALLFKFLATRLINENAKQVCARSETLIRIILDFEIMHNLCS